MPRLVVPKLRYPLSAFATGSCRTVLIVGAGLVGLTMAIELSRYGVSVRLVDKALERTDKSKALVIWSRTLELLERSGCSAALIDAGYKVTPVNISAAKSPIALHSRRGRDRVPLCADDPSKRDRTGARSIPEHAPGEN